MATGGGTRAVITALAANIGIAVAKFIGFALTGSSSMLAESIHSAADSSNQGLLLFGASRSHRKASEVHQFGYGRTRYVAGFVVSIVLFTLGGLFALYEAWHKFGHPEPIESWKWVPITVLLAALVMESFALRTALHEAEQARGKLSLLEFVHISRSPELPVIVMEDSAAIIGLLFGLFGVSMTIITHNGRWDAVGSAAIGVLLVAVAIYLAREMISMLIGESALPEHQDAIEAAMLGEGVDRVIHMRTLHLGPDEVLVAAKLAVTATDSAEQIASAINAAEARVRASVPLKLRIYIEPDLFSDDYTPTHEP
ncbi:MAG: cation diffusion facilitator family transporter [Microthrixaceae bacterium]